MFYFQQQRKRYIMKSCFHQYGVHFIKFLKHEGLANRKNLLGIDGHKSHLYNLANRKNLLGIDGHKSHLYNLPFYEAMWANGIEVLRIPPHTSHVLQPLDSIPFAQLKENGKRIFEDVTAHSGRSLNKVDFWEVFSPS